MSSQEPQTQTCALSKQSTSQTAPSFGSGPNQLAERNDNPLMENMPGRREGVVSNPDPESVQ